MFEIIQSAYGKELGVFEFDYLGEHPALDTVLLNAKVKFYEKGLHISSGLSSDSLFVEWDSVKGVTYIKNEKTRINLNIYKGVIKLRKEKEKTDISQFERMLRYLVPGISVEYAETSPDNLRSINMKRAEKLFEEQERRVDEFVRNCSGEDDSEIVEAWQKYLEDHLQFPFHAEIVDDPGPLEVGDVIKVISIDGTFDLYGIIVKARMGRKQYSYPLCLLESIEKESQNYQLIDDYNFWFSNR